MAGDGPSYQDVENDIRAAKLAQLQRERDDAVRALRSVCGVYGDTDWRDDEPLADIIQNHLHVQLDEAQGG